MAMGYIMSCPSLDLIGRRPTRFSSLLIRLSVRSDPVFDLARAEALDERLRRDLTGSHKSGHPTR